MLERILSTTMDNVPNDGLSIQALMDSSPREPKIRIGDSFVHFSHNWNTVNPLTYMVWQALSKLLPYQSKLNLTQHTITGPDTSFDCNFIRDTLLVGEDYTIVFAPIAITNIKKSHLKFFREQHGGITPARDELFQAFTEGTILGINVYNNKKYIIVFLNKDNRIDTFTQLKTMCLIYKLIHDDNSNTKEDTFFNDLSVYFAESNTDVAKLLDIFYKYAEGLPEYTIDKTAQIELIIQRIKKKKLRRLESEVKNARENLNYALNEVSRATSVYNDINREYSIMKNSPEDDVKNAMQEAFDFITRSKHVVKHGIEDNSLWFIVRTPIAINDKEEWTRISQRLITEPKLRELINKALIDEEYEIWTESRICFNFETNAVSRYGGPDRVTGDNVIPQPHLQGYNCFGMHSGIIANLLSKSDLLGALEQTIEAASGLNVFDAPVTSKFVSYVTGHYTRPFIKTPEKWISPEEYIEGEKENENPTTETEVNY